jgi:hypothetical protein
MGPADRNDRRSIEIAGRPATYPMSAEGECDHPKTGNGDREKETGSNEPMKRPHDRTPLFDQTIDCSLRPPSKGIPQIPPGNCERLHTMRRLPAMPGWTESSDWLAPQLSSTQPTTLAGAAE